MLADYGNVSQEDAANRLMQHLGADDLNALNNDQRRIILVSHRFAPEVTSAALWLNEKASGENLITCIKLTPYWDGNTGSLYIQASTIIPVPGVEEYVVGISSSAQQDRNRSGGNFAENLQRAYARNMNDEVTHFLRKVAESVVSGLPNNVIPDKRSRWAGRRTDDVRYYHFWYSRRPWSNWGTSFQVNLWPHEEADSWRAKVEFKHDRSGLESALAGVNLHHDQQLDRSGIEVDIGTDTLNGDFADRIAEMTRKFIEQITPVVDDLENESE